MEGFNNNDENEEKSQKADWPFKVTICRKNDGN